MFLGNKNYGVLIIKSDIKNKLTDNKKLFDIAFSLFFTLFVLLSIIIVIKSSLFFDYAFAKSESLERFNDPITGISIKYPSKWKIMVKSSNYNINNNFNFTAFTENTNNNGNSLASFSIGIKPSISYNPSLQSSLQDTINNLRTSKNFKVIESNTNSSLLGKNSFIYYFHIRF